MYIRLLECTGCLCVFKNGYIQGYALYFWNEQNSREKENKIFYYDANLNSILIKYLIYLKLRKKYLLSD